MLLGGFEAEEGFFGLQRCIGLLRLQTEDGRHFGEKALGEGLGGFEGIFGFEGRVLHHAEKNRPREQGAAMQTRGPSIKNGRTVAAGDDVAFVVEPATASAAVHLQKLIWGEFMLAGSVVVSRAGDMDAAHAEIDACGESHRRDDDAELACFGERLDNTSTCAVAEAAVMKSDAPLDQGAQIFAAHAALLGREVERIAHWQIGGETAGDGFGFFASWGENEQRREIGHHHGGGKTRPVVLKLSRALRQGLHRRFFERHRTVFRHDDLGFAPETAQPGDDVVRIRHGAAEQEQTRVRRGERDGGLVVRAACVVGDHLVFVDDEQRGPLAAHEALELRLQRGDDDRRIDILRDVAGGDADMPLRVLPFGVFVIREGSRGHGVDGLAAEMTPLMQQLKDVRLPRAGGRADDDIGARTQQIHRLVLPGIGELELVDVGEHGARAKGRREVAGEALKSTQDNPSMHFDLAGVAAAVAS